MEEITAREKVLKQVRNALLMSPPIPLETVDWESPVYKELADSPEIVFAQEFTAVSGRFMYCTDEKEFAEAFRSLADANGWSKLFCRDTEFMKLLDLYGVSYHTRDEEFLGCKQGLTRCECLIARLGSIMVSSGHVSGRRLNVYPETHVVVAYTSQLVPDLKEAFAFLKSRYGSKLPSLISVITGPSRTADIEKTLVMGAHGPKELFVFLIEDGLPSPLTNADS